MSAPNEVRKRNSNKDDTKNEDTTNTSNSNGKTVHADNPISTKAVVLVTVLFTASFCCLIFVLFVPFIIQQTQGSYVPNYSTDWLDNIENQVKKYYEKPVWKGKGEVQMLWQTPILKLNLYDMKRKDIVKFNSKLAASILHEYYKLIENNPTKFVKLGTEKNGANQAFYDWQMQGGWNFFAQQEEFKQLTEYFQEAADIFLRAMGKDEDFIRNRSRAMQMWATVHESCISHPPHSHPSNLVSGVYYVKIPSDSGSIIFDDPRGPLPPFDNRLSIKPKQGDMVLFPSWLLHQVSATFGTEERISIPFNIEGEWESTTGLSVTFPVDVR